MPPATRRSGKEQRRQSSQRNTKRIVSAPRTATATSSLTATTRAPRRSYNSNDIADHRQDNDAESCSSSADSSTVSSSSSSQETNGRRRSSRGNSSLNQLARAIVEHQKHVLFITGAGLSVASGIRPFRGAGGVWTHHIWNNSTRAAFRSDPLEWYNDFWLPCLGDMPKHARPNAGHQALEILMQRFPFNLKMITQNVDGLHPPGNRTIEAHGRLGLFKCIPEEDSDTDSDDDTDDDRLVHLGHRRKHGQRKHCRRENKCPYRRQQSLTVDQIEPPPVREPLRAGKGPLPEPPHCPVCGNDLLPQALLFDEGYHSHDFYQFQKMEEWLASAEVIVFVGTSFAVRLPEVTLEHARSAGIPVFNFNTNDMLPPTLTLNANNIRGAAEVTLPMLLREVEQLQQTLDHPEPVTGDRIVAGGKPPRLRRSSRRKRPLGK
ncbi:MAG: hypothetical protein SGILL_006583 [Bacillariaceae sp.]